MSDKGPPARPSYIWSVLEGKLALFHDHNERRVLLEMATRGLGASLAEILRTLGRRTPDENLRLLREKDPQLDLSNVDAVPEERAAMAILAMLGRT